ncbi:MAG: hypothetical protein KDC00_11100 [Flavobacteriales bacterium]|nr:hypothetical protein [Flavobacteriales bacterium]
MGHSSIIVHDQVIGISVQSDGSNELHYVHLRKSRAGIHVLDEGTATDATSLKEACGTRIPLVLAWDATGCINRISRTSGPLEELMPQAFPGARVNDLHISGWSADQCTGMSIVRKDQLHDSLQHLREAGFRIVDLLIGPWALLHLRSVLPEGEQDRSLAGRTFQYTNSELQAVRNTEPEPTVLTIGTETIANTHALAMAAAWEYFVPAQERLLTEDEPCAVDRREERARVRYEFGLVALAASLLLMLMVDIGLRSALERTSGAFKQDHVQHNMVEQEISRLRVDVEARETIAAQLGVLRGERFAVRAKRILSEVPSTVVLDRLILDPLEAPLRKDELPSTAQGRVQVSGSCTNGEALHSWMNALRTTPGISSVRIADFTSEDRDGRSVFTIELEG